MYNAKNEKVYEMILETECSGSITLAESVTMPQANFIVDGLDARYEATDWDGDEDATVDALADGDPLAHYEGCNILLQADGVVLLYTGEKPDGWETL